MEQYGLEQIRNVVLLAHGGAGKTTVAEAILFTTGAISRLGKVDEGTSTSDYDPDEVKRKISISLTPLPCEWQKVKINLLDAPGYSDFIGEVRGGIRVSDGAIITICAASGVEVGTEQAWRYREEAGLPGIIFVNKMDRENADFLKAVSQVQSRLSPKCLPVQLPIGAHTGFRGIIDLVDMKAYLGQEGKEAEVPAEFMPQASSLREKLVEAVAEVDDSLLEKYLAGEEISLDEIKTTLGKATASGAIMPILAGSGLQCLGIKPLMEAIKEYLPSPKERGVLTEAGTLEPSQEGPLGALVFKTTADPYVGKLSYFRVYTGSIESNSQVWNASRNASERIGQLYMVRGKSQEPVPRVGAGDIGAVAKLTVTTTGDTLCSQDKPLKLVPVQFPEPVFDMAVYPRTKADLDKLGAALTRLAEEDPTLHVRRDAGTGETVISGMGDTQIEVAADRMARKFGVGVLLQTPKVPYRETITVPAKAEYKHKKQTGGHGQYGHVLLELEPLPRASGNQFAERVVGGSVPKNYIPAVEKGVNEAFLEGGVLAHYPVADVKATLYDGSFHPVDSSEICFKIAGAGALKKGLAEGHPVLLEPIMNLRVTVPADLTGDIIGDLNTKRAHVLGITPEGDKNIIEARVPLAEIQRYAIDLKSMTQGRGVFQASFSHYEEVPAHAAQKIIAERQAEKAAEKA
ncbi:MAG: elongation factor G [Chloroflexi bacterium]|nr:elongation factor G [Chloroflexota bacterium]